MFSSVYKPQAWILDMLKKEGDVLRIWELVLPGSKREWLNKPQISQMQFS